MLQYIENINCIVLKSFDWREKNHFLVNFSHCSFKEVFYLYFTLMGERPWQHLFETRKAHFIIILASVLCSL